MERAGWQKVILYIRKCDLVTCRKVLISEDLDEPRSIVLDLETGWMFWSDWGRKPRIERAWMDGSHREIIIDTELVW